MARCVALAPILLSVLSMAPWGGCPTTRRPESQGLAPRTAMPRRVVVRPASLQGLAPRLAMAPRLVAPRFPSVASWGRRWCPTLTRRPAAERLHRVVRPEALQGLAPWGRCWRPPLTTAKMPATTTLALAPTSLSVALWMVPTKVVASNLVATTKQVASNPMVVPTILEAPTVCLAPTNLVAPSVPMAPNPPVAPTPSMASNPQAASSRSVAPLRALVPLQRLAQRLCRPSASDSPCARGRGPCAKGRSGGRSATRRGLAQDVHPYMAHRHPALHSEEPCISAFLCQIWAQVVRILPPMLSGPEISIQ